MFTGAGRYNDGYGDTYGPYDSAPFQTVPSAGTNGTPDQWSHNHDLGTIAAHAHHHPAFLPTGIQGRDPINSMGPDTKPMLQNGMITGYPNSTTPGGPCFTGIFFI